MAESFCLAREYGPIGKGQEGRPSFCEQKEAKKLSIHGARWRRGTEANG
jgi:hypothetical protein